MFYVYGTVWLRYVYSVLYEYMDVDVDNPNISSSDIPLV